MSALIHVKNVILQEMKESPTKLKEAVNNLINAIDSDLDVRGYEHSSDVDETIDALDKVLIEQDEENQKEEEIVINTPRRVSRVEE